MTSAAHFMAFDLGAASGRAIAGSFDGRRLSLQEIHRFSSGPVRVLDSLYWDALRLFSELKQGLARAVHRHGLELASLGLDTWGVSFALLDRHGALLGNPHHYRDPQIEGMLEEAFRRTPREEIFEQTGIQFLLVNTLYHLLSMELHASPLLSAAGTLLMTPDLFNYWLTGHKVSERTIASTSQCFNPNTGDWARPLLEKMGIPTHIFPPIVPPGTVLGELLPAVADETGARGVAARPACGTRARVVAPGCHDTACAVAAVPATGAHYAYLSSGTWSVMGAEVAGPVITAESLAYNFTNEGGVCDTIRLLNNMTGLWVIQECRRAWAVEGEALSYQELTEMAEAAPPFVAIIDTDAPSFLSPGDMPARIREFCACHQQSLPQDKGAMLRAVLESLALKYRWTLEKLEEVLGYRLEPLHIVGGGSQNQLLNQFAANATQRPVVAGPAEATAIGNLLMQMLPLGHIASLEEGRDLVRRSFEVRTYEPRDAAAWDEAYESYLSLIQTQ